MKIQNFEEFKTINESNSDIIAYCGTNNYTLRS